jgi:hypothetical protein
VSRSIISNFEGQHSNKTSRPVFTQVRRLLMLYLFLLSHQTSAVQRFYILGRIWLMAVDARAPCGDCSNNNKVILIEILIKIITDFIFCDSISWTILKFTRNKFYL